MSSVETRVTAGPAPSSSRYPAATLGAAVTLGRFLCHWYGVLSSFYVSREGQELVEIGGWSVSILGGTPAGGLPFLDDPGGDQQVRVGVIFAGFQIAVTVAIHQIIRYAMLGVDPNGVELAVDA